MALKGDGNVDLYPPDKHDHNLCLVLILLKIISLSGEAAVLPESLVPFPSPSDVVYKPSRPYSPLVPGLVCFSHTEIK